MVLVRRPEQSRADQTRPEQRGAEQISTFLTPMAPALGEGGTGCMAVTDLSAPHLDSLGLLWISFGLIGIHSGFFVLISHTNGSAVYDREALTTGCLTVTDWY